MGASGSTPVAPTTTVSHQNFHIVESVERPKQSRDDKIKLRNYYRVGLPRAEEVFAGNVVDGQCIIGLALSFEAHTTGASYSRSEDKMFSHRIICNSKELASSKELRSAASVVGKFHFVKALPNKFVANAYQAQTIQDLTDLG